MLLKTIDRYIIGKYLASFFFTALLFTMISLVIDISQHIDKFIEAEMSATSVLDYYINYIPYINGLLWPLFALIAVIFFTSRMASDAEIISILNAGVSFRRMMLPYALSALLITGILLYANHYLIPNANQVRHNYENTEMNPGSDEGKDQDVLIAMGPDQIAYIRSYSKSDSVARDVRLESYTDGRLSSILRARRMSWAGTPNRWTLENYEIRKIEGESEELIFHREGKLDTALNIYHSDFVAYADQMETMNTTELQEFITELRRKGVRNTRAYMVELHRRTSEPVTVLILTVIGMAMASRKVRGGIGLHLATGVLLGALYIFLSKFSITYATNERLTPFLGVWIPNILFLFVALILVGRAQK